MAEEKKQSLYAQMLDKENFLQALKARGLKEDEFEAKWNQIEQDFALRMYEIIFSKLEQKVKDSITEVPSEIKEMNDEKYLELRKNEIERINTYIKDNPNAVDMKVVLEQVVKIIIEKYLPKINKATE